MNPHYPSVLTPESTRQLATQVESEARSLKEYNVALGYLRAFIIVLVVAHHAVLAYHPYAPPPPTSLVSQPRWWGAFPVVDTHRWAGFGFFTGFNDTFFMALMFFLSGCFLPGSLERKETGTFLRDRLLRLGVPFIIAAGFLAPLAYYPAFLQTGSGWSLAGFWKQWSGLGNWPAGPAWFLWVLLGFDVVTVVALSLRGNSASVRQPPYVLTQRPFAFFALLVLLSAAVYIPMALFFGPMDWKSWGPFTFQTSRLFHYALYFLAGVLFGRQGLERTFLTAAGALAKRWALWLIFSLCAFAFATVITILVLTSHIGSMPWAIAGGGAFSLSCAASGFAFLAIFLRFAGVRGKLFDSLSANCYGIYLLHYPLVSWLQYGMLNVSIPGFLKGATVTFGALILSWVLTAGLRCSPLVRRII